MNRLVAWLAAAFGLVLSTETSSHHGWRSFDTTRPIYLEGTVQTVLWTDPHAELVLRVPEAIRLPADLVGRQVPSVAGLDGNALLRRAALPQRLARNWVIELAAPSQMRGSNVPQLQAGDSVAMIGYAFPAGTGSAILKVEFLFVGGKAYAMRSAPAQANWRSG